MGEVLFGLHSKMVRIFLLPLAGATFSFHMRQHLLFGMRASQRSDGCGTGTSLVYFPAGGEGDIRCFTHNVKTSPPLFPEDHVLLGEIIKSGDSAKSQTLAGIHLNMRLLHQKPQQELIQENSE